MFDSMYSYKAEIEAAAGQSLDWFRLDNKKASIISLDIKGLNFKKKDNYPELMDTVIDKVVILKNAIKPYIG